MVLPWSQGGDLPSQEPWLPPSRRFVSGHHQARGSPWEPGEETGKLSVNSAQKKRRESALRKKAGPFGPRILEL